MARVICYDCAHARHPHDRYTYKGALAMGDPSLAGSDAGCPRVVAGGEECTCPVREPRVVHGVCPTCGQDVPR